MTSYAKTAHEFAALEEPTAANFNSGALGQIGYAYNTSDQASISGSNVDVNELTVTTTVGTNRMIKVSANAHVTTSGTCTYYLTLTMNGTAIGRIARETGIVTATVSYHSGFTILRAPTAGSQIFGVQVTLSSGTGLTISGTGGTEAELFVEDCGSTT